VGGQLDDATLNVTRLRDGAARTDFNDRIAATKSAWVDAQNAWHDGIIWATGDFGQKKSRSTWLLLFQ